MTSEFGYTARGEHLPIVADPFLTVEFPRDAFEDANQDDQAAMRYLVRGALALRDRWTVKRSFLWDAILLECWIGRS